MAEIPSKHDEETPAVLSEEESIFHADAMRRSYVEFLAGVFKNIYGEGENLPIYRYSPPQRAHFDITNPSDIIYLDIE